MLQLNIIPRIRGLFNKIELKDESTSSFKYKTIWVNGKQIKRKWSAQPIKDVIPENNLAIEDMMAGDIQYCIFCDSGILFPKKYIKGLLNVNIISGTV